MMDVLSIYPLYSSPVVLNRTNILAILMSSEIALFSVSLIFLNIFSVYFDDTIYRSNFCYFLVLPLRLVNLRELHAGIHCGRL